MPEFINGQEFLYDNLLKTGQITCYFIEDDGDKQKGQGKIYDIKTTDQFSGTINVDCPHYAAATISFDSATKTISDSANGLATILTGDTVRIRGSGSNDAVLTVAGGGVAGSFTVNEAIVDEVAGTYITICKRASHSNNAVVDLRSDPRFIRRMWARYVQTGKIGPASDGKLNWYDATKCYTLHPAAANLAMVAGNILRVEGSDESSRYFAGQVLVCSGFTNAVNNLPGLVVSSVSFTGGNTDIVVDPENQILIAEVAAGARTINIICQSIYAYCAAANTAGLGGYNDWRVPNINELDTILNRGGSSPYINTTAFPSFLVGSDNVWTSTTYAGDPILYARYVDFTSPMEAGLIKTTNIYCFLVRGG